MKLIVGLGNPGLIYSNSRHNIGFSVVKSLAKLGKVALKRDKGTFSLSAKARLGAHHVILAIPLTFMNLSGLGVSVLAKKYKIDFADLLVVSDDLDLEFGRMKIRPSGSSAGHRGMQSIIDTLGSRGFCRLRIGIGRPDGNKEARDYVLSQFNRKEKAQLKEILDSASDCCQVWASEGITEAMNMFNRRSN